MNGVVGILIICMWRNNCMTYSVVIWNLTLWILSLEYIFLIFRSLSLSPSLSLPLSLPRSLSLSLSLSLSVSVSIYLWFCFSVYILVMYIQYWRVTEKISCSDNGDINNQSTTLSGTCIHWYWQVFLRGVTGFQVKKLIHFWSVMRCKDAGTIALTVLASRP